MSKKTGRKTFSSFRKSQSHLKNLLGFISVSEDGCLDVSRETASNYKQVQTHLINQTNNSKNRAKLSLTRYQGKY